VKLRIQGDAIRLRLTRPEVERFERSGRVECAIHFSGGSQLAYIVERVSGLREIEARYSADTVLVRVPDRMAAEWTGSDQVGLAASQGGLEIVIEKDFQCLHKDRRDPEAYPNPEAL
jgi:Family of unknown function (DUF7009)